MVILGVMRRRDLLVEDSERIVDVCWVGGVGIGLMREMR